MTDDDRWSTVETSRVNNNKSKYNMKLLNFIFIIIALAQSNLFESMMLNLKNLFQCPKLIEIFYQHYTNNNLIKIKEY